MNPMPRRPMSTAAGRTRRRIPVALGALVCALGCAEAPAFAKTCTRALSETEFAGAEIAEVICGDVAARLMPLASEMYHRRWSGELIVRSVVEDAQAKIALAAFDAEGNLIGAASFHRHNIGRRAKRIPFYMEGMFTSIADTEKILLSVSVPERK